MLACPVDVIIARLMDRFILSHLRERFVLAQSLRLLVQALVVL